MKLSWSCNLSFAYCKASMETCYRSMSYQSLNQPGTMVVSILIALQLSVLLKPCTGWGHQSWCSGGRSGLERIECRRCFESCKESWVDRSFWGLDFCMISNRIVVYFCIYGIWWRYMIRIIYPRTCKLVNCGVFRMSFVFKMMQWLPMNRFSWYG